MPSFKPTDGELQILQVLWSRGPSTVKEVNEQLSLKKDVGYTTSLKIMQIMHEKGLVDRKKDGRTHIYQANVSREQTQKQMVDKLLDTAFKGSASQLVMQALGNHKTSDEELNKIRKFLDKLEGGNK